MQRVVSDLSVAECISQLQSWVNDPKLRISHSSLHRTGAAGKGAFAEVDTATWNQDHQRQESDADKLQPPPSSKLLVSKPSTSSAHIPVAVKRFKSEVLANDTHLKLLISEIGILMSTRHKHIIRVYGLGTKGDDIRKGLYLVQEFAPGGTMKRLILEQMMNFHAFGLKAADLVEWCHQLASVLAYLHCKSPPIVHRDVKAENILFSAPLMQWGMARQKSTGCTMNLGTTSAEIKLIDFGLARRLPTASKHIEAEKPVVEKTPSRDTQKEISWTKSFQSPPSGFNLASLRNRGPVEAVHDNDRPSNPPASRGTSFSRIMNPSPFKLINSGLIRTSLPQNLTTPESSEGNKSVSSSKPPSLFSQMERRDKKAFAAASPYLPSLDEEKSDNPSLQTSRQANARTVPKSEPAVTLLLAKPQSPVASISPGAATINNTTSGVTKNERWSRNSRNSRNSSIRTSNGSVAHGVEASKASIFTRAVSTVRSFVGMPSSPSASEKVQELFDLTGNTGSLLYMAPEVFLGEKYNEKVDIFSFAMVMYELLHRRLILTSILEKNMGADVEEMEGAITDYAAAVAGGYRPPLSTNLPDSLVNILSLCWSEKPEDRPSAQVVAARLAKILENEDLSPLDKSPQGGCDCGDGCVIS